MTEPFFPYALKDSRTLQGQLADPEPVENSQPIPFMVEADDRNIVIGFDGYGDANSSYGYSRPLHVEYYEGKLRLLVWSDINQEEPTHVIDMCGALESNRKP